MVDGATPTDGATPVVVHVQSGRLVYDDALLFDGLSLTLKAGVTTCLLGSSGIGKSSLLRLIAGLGPVAAGSRVWCGDGGPVVERIAYMDQRDLLLPWLSVLDNVTLGSRLRGQRPHRDRALSLLRQVGLSRQASDRPVTLSGGMRQRAALARTLMEDRAIVLMDEPFSSLDTLTRMRLQELAAGLLQMRTVLLVTHDPMEALRLGERIHVMSGRPARLDQPLVPPGKPPRDPTSEMLISLHRDLLMRLRAAQAAPAGAAA